MIKNYKIVFLISLIFSIFILTVSKADTKCLNKTGLISDKYKYLKKDHKFKDPKNTIIFLQKLKLQVQVEFIIGMILKNFTKNNLRNPKKRNKN